MGSNIVTLWIASVVFLVCVHDCGAGDRVFKGKICNRIRKPVSSAVVYVEAYQEGKGAFDFGYAVVDQKSEGAFSLAVKWKRNAILAYAVFAPAMNAIAGFDRTHYYETYDLMLELDSTVSEEDNCETRLVGMSFPFEKIPALANRLRRTEYRQLIKAFLSAYEPIFEGTCQVPWGNDGKIRAVKELRRSSKP